MIIFTKNERLVLLCFAGIVLAGTAARYVYVRHPNLLEVVNVLETERSYPKTDLNSADDVRLQSIPSIGSYRAQQILNYRHTFGHFNRVEDLKKVRGISEKTYQKIRNYFKVAHEK